MLGAKHREHLPALYLTTRGNRSHLPAWLHLLWLTPLFVLLVFLSVFSGRLPMLYVGLALFLGTLFFGRRLLIRSMLGRRRGRVCPCCWRASDQPSTHCKGCQTPAGLAMHRTYWRIARLNPAAAEQWFSDQYRVEGRRPPMTRTFKLLLGLLLVVLILAVTWIVIQTVYFNNLSWMNGGISAVWVWFVIIPCGWLGITFAKRRAGNTLHCASCEYQLAPNAPRPDTCPECGHGFAAPGAVMVGQRVGSRWPAAVMMLIFLLVFVVLPFSGVFSRSTWSTSNLIPTDTLIQHVLVTDDPEWAAWEALENRSFTATQFDALVDGLEQHLSGETDRPDDSSWEYRIGDVIAGAASKGSLSHAMQLRLLAMYHEFEYDFPFEIRQWVEDAIGQGVYTQAEINAAEMYKPIKQVSTDEFVEQVVQAQAIEWTVRQEIETRSIDDHNLAQLLDEMHQRLSAGRDLSYRGDPTSWGRHVAGFVVAEANRREVPRWVRLRMYALASTFRNRVPYVLEDWVWQAELNGRLKLDLAEDEDEANPAGE